MKYIVVFINFFTLSIFTSCSLFFEPDISDEIIELYAPSDSLTTITTQLFWWSEVENATNYQLQIATPAFDRVKRLLLDTVISTSKFNYTLYPSVFECRVRALNNSSATSYFSKTIRIDSTLDLSFEKVIVSEPIDNFYSNQKLFVIQWQNIYNADTYVIEIRKDQWGSILLVKKMELAPTKDSIHIALPEGIFYWSIIAKNDYTQTETIKIPYKVSFDFTPPNTPELLKPNNNDTIINNPYLFKWTSFGDNLTGIAKTLISICSDSTFSSDEILQLEFTDNQASIDLSQLVKNKYFAKAVCVDRAGNISQSSQIKKFYLEDEE